ncbi:DsbA family protein [Candidatus Peribacteria bacterium]|nr:DsbA family protein [Candidatus Peribacteria bacterium]
MKRFLTLLALPILLSACVDTTGISAESSRKPQGNAMSVVVITEFSDLECPACRSANMTIVKPLLEKYGTQVRFDYTHFPLRSLHRHTMELAEAAECAADQGKFTEFVDLAFENQPELAKGKALEWGSTLVSDKDLFTRCVKSKIKDKAIMSDYDAGVAMGVQGTPSFFVNGKQTDASLEALSTAIEAQLKGAQMRL